MDCLVLPVSLLRRRSMTSRLGYRPLTEEGYGDQVDTSRQVTVVVGKEKREFLVDPFVLEESPFRVLMETLMKKEYGHGTGKVVDHNINATRSSSRRRRDDRRRVIFVDVDAILFEHMLWLMNNDCSSLFQLNVEEIIDFYAQDN